MAANFKNGTAQGVGQANVTVYTAGNTLQSAICIGLGISYTGTIGNSVLTNCWLVNSANTATTILALGEIPGGSTLVLVGGDQKLVLQPGDSIRVNANANVSCDVIASILELS